MNRFFTACLGCSLSLSAQEAVTDAPDKTPSDFVRFVAVDDGGHLDTAITTYKKGAVEVVLYGAVHIADGACYAALNDRFTTCDVLLYELIGPPDYRPTKGQEERGFNPLSMLQQGLKNSLELTFQLDEIDYQAPNFVHADMTPQEFQESMAERGESLLSIMLDMMMSGMRMQQEQAEKGAASPPAEFDLVKAFQRREGRHLLRMTFGQQIEEIEKLSLGKDGSTLLEGRNDKCLEVLQREMARGHKRIGIYYGAAHLPHMERRLVDDLGFTKVGHEWLVAWDCHKRADVKYDRDLIKQRQQCRDELKALIAAGRNYRLANRDASPVTPAELKASEGAQRYDGPQQDPWGNNYVLRRRPTGARWEAVSRGQDGVSGTADDLIAIEPRRGGLLGF